MSELYSLAMSVLLIVGMWKIFEKADVAGWKCIIPFYGTYVEWKILRKPGFFWLYLISACLAGIACGLIIGGMFATIGLDALISTENFDATMVSSIMTAPIVLAGGFVMLIASCLVLVTQIVRAKQYKKCFNLSTGMAIGIFFLPEIFLFIVGVDKQYQYALFNPNIGKTLFVNDDPWNM